MAGSSVALEPVASLPGRVKVKLVFKTWEPKHIRSLTLKTEFAAPAPYMEDICVLVEARLAAGELHGYRRLFERLVADGIVPKRSVLMDHRFLYEDRHTLAYPMEIAA